VLVVKKTEIVINQSNCILAFLLPGLLTSKLPISGLV